LKSFRGRLQDFRKRLKSFGGRLQDFRGRLKSFGGRLQDFRKSLKNFGEGLKNFRKNLKNFRKKNLLGCAEKQRIRGQVYLSHSQISNSHTRGFVIILAFGGFLYG
jgi:chromosome segregation ATPase